MKAGVFTTPGCVEVREWPEPMVGSGQVKVKIAYTGLCGSDVEALHRRLGYQPMGLKTDGSGPRPEGPELRGHEATGTIVEVGPELKGDWRVGQRVVLSLRAACGVCYYCRTRREHFCEHVSVPAGAFAEFCTFPEGTLYALPEDVSFELAALTEPTSIAVHAVDLAGTLNGQTLAIVGGGTIGLLTLAVALRAGACKVLLSEPVAGKREMALRMGAHRVVDPSTEDLAAAAAELTAGRGFDAVIEASGSLRAAEQTLQVVGKGGTVVWVSLHSHDEEVPVKPFEMYLKELTVRSTYLAPYCFGRALALLPGLNVGSLITNIYPLDELAEAFKNHEKGESIKTLVRM